MHKFFQPGIENGVDFLDKEESFHCAKVLRLKEKDAIEILDGNGTVVTALITDSHIEKVKFQITKKEVFTKKEYYIHLAIAPPKNQERLEWMLEKSCEIGFDKITLIEAENSEKWKLRMDRLQKKMISAIKQSSNPFLPELEDFISFDEFVGTTVEEQLFICYVDPQNNQHLNDLVKKNNSYCILIGPEGDFSPTELQKAIQSGFAKVSLGTNRLRTETAGLTAVIMLNLINS